MLYHYVIYYDKVKLETSTVRFTSSGLACGFVEKKVENAAYELVDFLVIHGKPITLQEKITRSVYVII